MKKLHHFIFLFLYTILSYSQTAPSYYNGLDLSLTGNNLFLELSTKIIDSHVGIPYTSSSTDVWDACKLADEDPENATNVLLIYGFDNTDGNATTDRTRSKDLQDTGGTTGTWNREHVFAKSLATPILATGSSGPGTDVHNLRPADTQRNSERSNRLFSDGSGDASYITSNGGWYPGDEWKGDIARIIMYMYTRYHGTGTQISETKCLPKNIGFGTINTIDPNMIDLFLQWNVDDPVNPFESNRNEKLAGIQENRNPFIDNPYLATLIWGGLAAEDKWNMGGTSDAEAPTEPTNLIASNETYESFDVSWNASTDNEGVYDYLIYLDGVYKQSSTSTSATILNLDPETTYVVTIKARDTANNRSEFSVPINATTLIGPEILLTEDFEDCASSKFFTYNEASDKNWICSSEYGENGSNSTSMNGYQEDVASKDWLITSNPIDFDVETGEKLSFYAGAAYGNSPLVLVYSSTYDGSGNPKDFTWEPVPNITIPIKSNTSGTTEIFTFKDIDISAITGTVYFAFKYYSNGVPTRWMLDNFEIIADNDSNPDSDRDEILNENDLCPNTPIGEIVDVNGCSNGQLDDDNDGIPNSDDLCISTPTGEVVNASGCSDSQLDDDSDGTMNNIDTCPNTPSGEVADVNGCSESQLDDDGDGVMNNIDQCPNTTAGAPVNTVGCFTLSANNFTIEILSETCPNKNNGQIIIVAQNTSYTYSVTINGILYNFSDTVTVSALNPETYDFCISVDNQEYSQCFTVVIDGGTTVEGKATVSSNKVTVNINKGTAPFNVFVNGKEVLSTISQSFDVSVIHGDLIEVKTAVSCEGVFAKKIELFDIIKAYPNPTNGLFKIGFPVSQKEVVIELYSIHSQLVSVKTYPIIYGKVQLTLENQPTGLYFAKIHLDKPVVIKILKK